MGRTVSRRAFVRSTSLLMAASASAGLSRAFAATLTDTGRLAEFGYGDVALHSELHETQLAQTHAVLMGLSDDSLLKPFREMAGQAAPGEELGGWYEYLPDYDYRTGDAGLAPGSTFGQWMSALSRFYAATGSRETRDKVLRLNRLYAQTISGDYYEKTRFPAYSYDKLVCGLMDAHQLADDPDAFAILKRTTDAALPYLPGRAIDRERSWRAGKDLSFNWDESYTLPENLLLAYQRGAGKQYRALGLQYLDDETFFDPLARGENILGGKHAATYVNALNSAMQAYLVAGCEKHLRAAKNAFAMLTEQSFATGGWGPDEMLQVSASDGLYSSLTKSHNNFETPCGAYAHFKLTRYLLRVTRDSRYGDSMERVMYNTVLGVRPLQADGRAFYYSDYNFSGAKVYSKHRWPCCSGTLPQAAADYRINTYFRDMRGVYVNLYIPSTLNWKQNGAQFSLTQKSGYPAEELIEFEVTASRPTDFAIRFRVPQWADGASVRVNGKGIAGGIVAGSFAAIERRWKTGDRVEVEIPMRMRLEAVDAAHAGTVALMRGPRVLFPIGSSQPSVTRGQLLAAKRTQAQVWEVAMPAGDLALMPFTAIDDQAYSTYLRVS